MQVTETLSEGLKREFRVTVPADELSSRLDRRLEELKGTARIKGFRPGKVPTAHLKRLVGRQTMSEIVNEVLKEQADRTIQERGERPAMQPAFDLPESEDASLRILDGKADLEYLMRYEVLPKVALGDFKDIAVERPVIQLGEEEVDRQLDQLARQAATYSAKDGPAADGDRLTIDYVGKIGDDAFEGGSDTGAAITLGSKQFIPGFEEQLTGAKAGEQRTLNIRFPEDYGAKNLAGKDATFEVTVHEVATPDSVVIDDDLAKKLGLDTADALRAAVRRQMEGQYAGLIRQRVKRQLLDALDGMHAFDLPPTMVEQEFEAIWAEVMREIERTGKSFADEGTTEEESRAFYQTIANRRVRLGLVLAEIGERNNISISDQELQRAVQNDIRRFPGQEQQLLEAYQSNPGAINRLRAPLYEEKVVDFLLELVKVTDRSVTPKELAEMAAADEAGPAPGEAAASA